MRLLTTVRAPVADGDEERARQRCLAHLAVELASRLQVGEMILDSRSSADPAWANRDAVDVATVMALKGAGELPPTFSLSHRHDQNFHQLLIPDVAAYAHQQAIRGAPERLQRLAEKAVAVEATRLPIDQRPALGATHARPTGLTERLDQLRTLGRDLMARQERDLGYQTGDQDRVLVAQERILRAQEHLARVHERVERLEARTGQPVPLLEEILHADGGRER